jgi:hypothetical protein
MPHDAKGRLIQVGDKVAIEFEVLEVFEGDFCNMKLRSVLPMKGDPTNFLEISAVNAAQAVRVGLEK